MISLYRKTRHKVEAVQQEFYMEDNYDVIVAGLGTAGSIAAITAAKNGLRVLGLETENCMGGQSTAGGVFIYYLGAQGGLYEEIDESARKLEKEGFVGTNEPYTTNGVNPEIKKYLLEKKAADAGVDIQFESTVIGVFAEEKKVQGVQWIHQNQIHNVSAKIVIDATADGYLCEMLGCRMNRGREIDGQCQPYSNVMITMDDGKINCRYSDCGYMDQYKEEDVSQRLIEANNYSLYNREEYSRKDEIISFSSILGCREGKRIVGEETLTLKKVLSGEGLSNPLFCGYANIDVHGKDMAFESREFQYWNVVCGLWGIRLRIPVPAGVCVPKDYEGILVAGRHLSVDHDIASALRMKRDMHKCGEVMGVLAYEMIKEKCNAKELTYEKMRLMLEENQCLSKDENKNKRAFFDEGGNELVLMKDTEILRAELAGEKPGWAVWSAIQMDDTLIVPCLKRWIQSGEKNLARNSALALASKGDTEAVVLLQKMVEEIDLTCFHNSSMYNQPRVVSAIFLLGELADVESLPLLVQVLDQKEKYCQIKMDFNEFIENQEDLYFQLYTYAVMALIRIGEKHDRERKKIKQIFEERIGKEDFHLYLNLKDGENLRYDMGKRIKKIVEEIIGQWN